MLFAGKVNWEGQDIRDAAGSFARAGDLGSPSQSPIICTGWERPLDLHRALGETKLCLICKHKVHRTSRKRLWVSRFQFSLLFTLGFLLLFPSGLQVLSSLCPQLA